MLDAIYEWMKNIAFYLVVMTAVLEVLPGNGYQKYIRFFTGLVLILLVITPLLQMTGMLGQFQRHYQSQQQELQQEIERQREYFESADAFDFLPEEYMNRNENTGESEEKDSVQEIRVEEIRVEEDKEQNLELDTRRK